MYRGRCNTGSINISPVIHKACREHGV